MKNINTVTPFEDTHFDRKTVTVTRLPSHVVEAKLGFPLSDDQVKRLCGATTSAKVTVRYKSRWSEAEVGEEDVPAGLFFEVENPAYNRSDCVVGIYLDAPSDELMLYIKSVNFIKGRVKSLAARMVAVIVREAKNIGITRLRLLAAGGRDWEDFESEGEKPERWGGYFAWPVYGFNMDLGESDLSLMDEFPFFPKDLSACATVLDVLNLEGGREWWKVCGNGHYMEFDLSSASTPSIVMLDAFLGTAKV